ncbi:MAG: hypothetical protein COA95_08405 [Methylophaga sp.]|nr:MAG: hypothetical protein COA95_08405 [Methylophaga sp.]
MKRNKGFTLVELMIVVAIIAILAAIAYPSYQGAIRDARRGVAEADLVELAGFMERYYTTNSKYTDTAGAPPALPFGTSPQEGTTVFYDLSVATPSSTAFTLTATPTGPQASDYCGTLSLDSTNTKNPAVSGCW